MTLQQITLGNIGVLEFTSNLCREVENIEGDFCEAGVAFGGQLVNMHLANTSKKIYAFDSFEGIASHGKDDVEFTQHYGEGADNPRVSNGVTSVPIEQCKQNMNYFINDLSKFIFVEGWFVDTLPKLTDEVFSIVRLDCDIYESYNTCLKYLYPRLSVGGYLIIDDWHLVGCRKAIQEYFGDKIMNDFIVDTGLGNAYLKKSYDRA